MREILSRWLEGQLGFNSFYDSSFLPLGGTWLMLWEITGNLIWQLSWKQSIVPVSSLCDMLLESTMQYNMALLELKMSVSVTWLANRH